MHLPNDSAVRAPDDLVVLVVVPVDDPVNPAPLSGIAVKLLAALHPAKRLPAVSVSSLERTISWTVIVSVTKSST